jgi:FkbM family methyltransferase
MLNKIINTFNHFILNKLGINLVKYPSYTLRNKIKLIKFHNIDLIIDVGANEGQFAIEMREMGYKGRIVSFEPLSSAFKILEINSINDPNWQIFNFALGDFDGTAPINISKNSQSSSLLAATETLHRAAPTADYTGSETISVNKLDSVFDKLNYSNNKALLKIDTQGFENAVLIGANESLKYCKGLQIEMCTTSVYDGSVTFRELFKKIDILGYELSLLEPALADPNSGRLLELDGTFYRY